MACAIPSSTTDENKFCTSCVSKYNRTRASFCQCQHCSIPLCVDCMKEHHDELLQDVEILSHDYNELRQVVQTKRTMIDEETTKCAADINQYFDSYVNQLHAVQRKILEGIDKAKQKAQDYIQKVDTDLGSTGELIEGLAKDGTVQMSKMKKVASELKDVEKQLTNFQMTKTDNLIIAQLPDFSIRFEYSPVENKATNSIDTKVNSKSGTELQQSPLETNALNSVTQPSARSKYALDQPESNDFYQDEDEISLNTNDDNNIDLDRTHIRATFNVDRMASDGENILYTTYYDDKTDRIAYCYLDDNDDEDDQYRVWKQPRIIDMIWWNSIGEFICATLNGIYSVDHTSRRFKILNVIRGSWSYIRVAGNTHELFVWINSTEDNNFNGIEIFSTDFNFLRAIDFDTISVGSFVNSSSSFCVTDQYIASICMRKQRNREVFLVTFCDLAMKKLNSIPLGAYDDDIEIRTDGNDQFFITTGTRRFYIIHSINTKKMIELGNNANIIAVLKNQRIAVSDRSADLETLTY